jgi:hypothetical protein
VNGQPLVGRVVFLLTVVVVVGMSKYCQIPLRSSDRCSCRSLARWRLMTPKWRRSIVVPFNIEKFNRKINNKVVVFKFLVYVCK